MRIHAMTVAESRLFPVHVGDAPKIGRGLNHMVRIDADGIYVEYDGEWLVKHCEQAEAEQIADRLPMWISLHDLQGFTIVED